MFSVQPCVAQGDHHDDETEPQGLTTMWAPLRGLWGGKPAAKTAPTVATAAAALAVSRPLPPSTTPSARPAPSAAEAVALPAEPALPGADAALDGRFSAFLLSLEQLRQGDAGPTEQVVLSRLEELIHARGPRELLPRLPAVLPKLMSLVRRDDVSVRELADHLSKDPALVSEVIRIANSPRYRASRTLGSLQDAVMVLGQQGMHQLVTNVAMRPVFNVQAGRFSQAARAHLWAQTARCAHACAYLQGPRSDQFEAYLAGMVVNAGLIPALRVLDQSYVGTRAPDTVAFHEGFLMLSLRISASIAKEWNFPDGVTQAVAALATLPPPQPPAPLAVVLRSADQVSKRHLLMSAQAQVLALEGDPVDPCFAELERVFGAGQADH
jgi:HD-like signal output (HDOD) protein